MVAWCMVYGVWCMVYGVCAFAPAPLLTAFYRPPPVPIPAGATMCFCPTSFGGAGMLRWRRSCWRRSVAQCCTEGASCRARSPTTMGLCARSLSADNKLQSTPFGRCVADSVVCCCCVLRGAWRVWQCHCQWQCTVRVRAGSSRARAESRVSAQCAVRLPGSCVFSLSLLPLLPVALSA
jgi:hypothetical protein